MNYDKSFNSNRQTNKTKSLYSERNSVVADRMHVKKYAESNPCLKSLDFDSVAFLFNEIGFAGL